MVLINEHRSLGLGYSAPGLDALNRTIWSSAFTVPGRPGDFPASVAWTCGRPISGSGSFCPASTTRDESLGADGLLAVAHHRRF